MKTPTDGRFLYLKDNKKMFLSHNNNEMIFNGFLKKDSLFKRVNGIAQRLFLFLFSQYNIISHYN